MTWKLIILSLHNYFILSFTAIQWNVNCYPPQISELCLQNHQLEDENGILFEKNAQNITEMENLQQQLAELIKEKERRELFPAEEKNEVNSVWWQTDGRRGDRSE